MRTTHQKLTCSVLAIAMALASVGCMTTIEHPTQAALTDRVHAGDALTVVLKSGQRRKFEISTITETEIQSNYEEPIPYTDIEKIRITHRKINSFVNDLDDIGDAIGTTVLVIVAIPVTIGIAYCALMCGGLARIDTSQPYNNGAHY